MIDIAKLIRKLKYHFGKKYVEYNDDSYEDCIPNEYIPDIIMDKDIVMYNYGYCEQKNMFKVLIRTSTQEKDC